MSCPPSAVDSSKNCSPRALLDLRRHHILSALSVSYPSSAVHMVGGSMQYLVDHEGRRYLDAVNNVAHVGHCHPQVVSAASAQMSTLCTNTRYLGRELVEYATELLKTFPPSLSVCVFTCSGSEANDLAIRMARTVTKRKDIAVVDWAYHGNTTALIEISPYKFKRKGGFPCPPYVHIIDLPDGYRGKYKYSDPEYGEKYAQILEQKLKENAKSGIAAFICESALGCGGQIILPPNYLKTTYKITRENGGLCIADEVQVGFGRFGDCFWGFESQGVVPDIVTLGKPIGNGHPMGAVITTKEVADAFSNGMEYFNTFGGNNVSCVIGKEVLRVIKNQKLQENSKYLGQCILNSLKELQPKYPLIGDVRGKGLFIGIELVQDQTSLTPATQEAKKISELLKSKFFILVSTDGPFDNVLKIKPPLCWTEENATYFVQSLRECLEALKQCKL